MTAIRNRNTSVPYVFRYPKWQEGVFYPLARCCRTRVANPLDSDQAYWDFYVARVDVVAADTVPPPANSSKYKLIMSTSTVGDSEVSQFLYKLDSEIKFVNRRVDKLVERDSDFLLFLDSEISERIANDSDIKFIKSAIQNIYDEIDSDLNTVRHDFAAADSDKLSGVTANLHDLKAFDSDILISIDSDKARVKHDYKAGDSDILVSVDSDVVKIKHDYKAGDSDLKVLILSTISSGFDYGTYF